MHHGLKALRRTLLAGALLLTSVVGTVALAGPAGAGGGPENSTFADRTPIPGTSATVVGTNVGAGLQAGEPQPTCCAMNQTVWWSWTATFTGRALLDTKGSDIDTIVGLYTGAALASLVEVDSDDDGGPSTRSRIEFDAVQGTQYQIQIDGYLSAEGTIRLRMNPVSFNDVSRTHPFWRDVEWIAGEEIAQGYLDGGYHPSANISRGAMSAFLFRLSGDGMIAPATPTFNDVPLNHPFFLEIEWMNAQDITTGYPGNLYKPANPVTRQAMAAFIYRYDDDVPFDPPEDPSFVDVGLDHDFFVEIEWMSAEGITTGYPGDLFKPAGLVSRAAMAAFLHRYEG